MRRKSYEKKKTLSLILLLLILGIGLGYALLTEQLTINNDVNYDSMKWDVGFSVATDGGGTISSVPTISSDKTTVTVTCDLGESTESETCITKATIANNGTFDIELESTPIIEYSNTYIKSVTSVWAEYSRNIVVGDYITSESSKDMIITITTKELTKEMLPETDLSIKITITMNWVQRDPSKPLNVYLENQLFPNVLTDFPESSIASLDAYSLNATPFSFDDSELFAGKIITKIGLPIKSVSTIDNNQKFTIYVINKDSIENKTTEGIVVDTIELYANSEDLGSDASAVNKWIYFDLNLTLTENQTLAFGSSTDTIILGFSRTNISDGTYGFYSNVLGRNGTLIGDHSDKSIIFDIYYLSEQSAVTALNRVLLGKNLSILGDSISTFTGYSNDSTNTNSTIGSNAVYYKGTNIITDVNETWWMQTANQSGMNVLVNNSWSGDTIASRGKTRATQLHDDTGSNSGTNPDIIAVYIGINDIKNGGTLETFTSDYNTMISNMRTEYPNAEIFVFTHVPYKYSSATIPNITDSALEEFNDVIRNIATQTSKCHIVDLYEDSGITSSTYTQYMGDEGLHPNNAGMDLITNTFINALIDVYVN